MKTFTCNSFTGHYPVGSAAVIVAETRLKAVNSLNKELKSIGLKGDVTEDQLEEVDTTKRHITILSDGNY